MKTVVTVLRRLRDRRSAAPIRTNPTIVETGFLSTYPTELTVRYEYEDMRPLGPIIRGDAFMQEMPIAMEFVSMIEILMAAYGRKNTNTNVITLLSETGKVLHEQELLSESVVENSFYALSLSVDLDVRHSKKIYLLLRSLDGTESNSVTAWRTIKGKSPLYRVLLEAGGYMREPRSLLEGGTLLEGSLIVRMRGKRTIRVPQYRKPPLPADFHTRMDAVRASVTVVANDVSEPCGANGLDLVVASLRGGGHSVARVRADNALRQVKATKPDFVIMDGICLTDGVRELLTWARSAYVPTLFFCARELSPDRVLREEIQNRKESAERRAAREVFGTFKACDFALCMHDGLRSWALHNHKTAFLVHGNSLDSEGGRDTRMAGVFAQEVLAAYKKKHIPKISVVSVLYGKAQQIGVVLDSYFRQSYGGEFEIIFVDDQSPDASAQLVEDSIRRARESGKYANLPQVRILRNERNLGNCLSRERGIRAATGEIIIIIDADCMVNRDFLKHHADAHSFDDCDVVIGSLNLETYGQEPCAVLQRYEEALDQVIADTLLQDPMNKGSFLNCITRNFSIKASFIEGELFDPLFSYSKDPESGFGWEDVEMGFRLYSRGARIKYVAEAFSVHVSHQSSVDENTKPQRSLRNFRRLFEKHPDLLLIARRWALETYAKIIGWADQNCVSSNDDRRFLECAFQRRLPARWHITSEPRLRVLTYRWHVPHQYELYKLPHEFTLVTDAGSNMTRTWELRQRPLPNNVTFRSLDEINLGEFDLAILHFDENVLAPQNTNGVIGPDWGNTFRWFQENVNLPKVAICHGTPQFRGQFNIDFKCQDLMSVIEDERLRLVDFLGDVLVIINSHQAQVEWGFKNSRVIWHGFDPTEFPPATYEKGVLSPFGPLVLSRPHYRGFFLYESVFRDSPEEHLPATLHVPDPDVFYEGNEYALAKFQNYIAELRRYSVYFNPTLRSPMPRARGEAMLCGLVTVSAKNHDVELFIKNGVNGFYSSDTGELGEYLSYLTQHPQIARRIGAAGRQTAADLFNHDRYLAEWQKMASTLIK